MLLEQSHITLFDTEADYNAFVASSGYSYHNVSYVEDTKKVHYDAVENQWVESGTTCDGYDKYEKEIKQWRYKDSGDAWENVDPEESRLGELIEADSEDCGYIP